MNVESITGPCNADDREALARILARCGRAAASALPVLQAVHAHFRYLPVPALEWIAAGSDMTLAQLTGLATFYPQFRLTPAGRHRIRLCNGTACHVKGAEVIGAVLERHLHIPAGGDTDPAGLFTIEKVACLGCCTLAPALQIDHVTYGHLAADTVPGVLQDFLQRHARRGREWEPGKAVLPGTDGEVRIGLGSCCQAKGSKDVAAAFEEAIRASGWAVRIQTVGCFGVCHQMPLVEVIAAGRPSLFYARVQPEDAAAIVRRHFPLRNRVRRILQFADRELETLLTGRSAGGAEHITRLPTEEFLCSFRQIQRRLASEHGGALDPLDLNAYRAAGGFEALRQCRADSTPAAIIAVIQASGLRGRGGAGYPTGRKWEQVRLAAGANGKVVIGNGDEGDPGAFMDRMLMESHPFRILEGMAIAGLAVGAKHGIVYVRAEYPLAVTRLRAAVERCRQAGLLGADRSSEQGFDGEVEIKEGAGAFVCGEETALLASIEGERGIPRLRPPYPSEAGFQGRPTLINNVETLALVPWILRHGAEAFAALGTERSKGTKVFALAGKVARGGLIEVPMGITIRSVVEELGGGIAEGKRFKAVQIGGPSGGCIPAELADLRIDYEELAGAGAIMGSGGLVVLDESDCMVDMARYFLAFTQDQSCGKCTHCRIGTQRMLAIMDRLCAGQGQAGDLKALEELAVAVQRGSSCGLGRTAPNPVLTTLKYFRAEYEAHLAGRCPAGKCRALIHYRVTAQCIGCTICAQHCPTDAIPWAPYRRHVIDDSLCIRCGQCKRRCPSEAIVVE